MNNEIPFSFVARRIVGPTFAVGGTIVALSFIDALLPGGTVLVDGVPSSDIMDRAFVVLFPTAIALLGVVMYRAKPMVCR